MSKNHSIKWAEITTKYGGAKYKLGGRNKKEGMDCLSLCFSVLRDLGKEIPENIEIEGINLKNYPSKWLEDPNKAKQALIKYLMTLTKKIDKGEMGVGDFLICTLIKGDMSPFIGIYAGSNRLLTAHLNRGVTIYKLNNYSILEVFRP